MALGSVNFGQFFGQICLGSEVKSFCKPMGCSKPRKVAFSKKRKRISQIFFNKIFNIIFSNMKISSSIEDLYNPQHNILKNLTEFREVEFENLLTLKISEFAFKKVKIIIKSAFEALNHAVESYWLFLGDKFIQDIIIPYQHVSYAFVEVDGINILNLKKIIVESNLEILGWGHSHADFGVFFSGTDWRNQKRVFNETSNYVNIKRKKKNIVSKVIIKYSYGSTFNIHEDIFVQLTWQESGGPIQHSHAKLEIIPSKGNLKFDFKSYGKEIHKYFSK